MRRWCTQRGQGVERPDKAKLPSQNSFSSKVIFPSRFCRCGRYLKCAGRVVEQEPTCVTANTHARELCAHAHAHPPPPRVRRRPTRCGTRSASRGVLTRRTLKRVRTSNNRDETCAHFVSHFPALCRIPRPRSRCWTSRELKRRRERENFHVYVVS